MLESGQKMDVPTYRFDVYNPDTGAYEARYWSCCNTPIFDAENKVAYILNTVVDITAEVKAKKEALESENRLRLAAEAAELATWDLNLHDQTLIYSPRLAEIFGHPADSPVTLVAIRSQVHVSDMREIVLKAYQESLITGNYLYEVRIHWPDGSLHWIKTQGLVMTNENKRPVRMLGTVADITEIKRDEIRKNDFIAMASHELKTPLTSLKAYVQLLAKKIPESENSFVNGALVKVNNQVNRMTELIHSFLDLSKMESGKLQLKMQPFGLRKLIEDTITETSLVNTGHEFKFEPGDEITANADREKIAQVIVNFLNNAVKYSNKDTIVTVKCEKIDGYVQVSVTDQGIGIKPKDQRKLFQRFYRVDNEQMKNISGFGIGLYLASEIIQRHKGKIGVESSEGLGSTFYFCLPVQE